MIEKIKYTSFDAIATALGPNYYVAEFKDDGMLDPRCIIRRKDGDGDFGIRLFVDNYEKKMTIRGCSAQSIDNTEYLYPYNVNRSIKCKPDKSAQAIANDIVRRFLPTYEEHFADACRRRDEHNQYILNVRANKKTIIDLLGGKDTQITNDKNDRLGVSISTNMDKGYLWGFRVGGDHVSFDARSVPIPIAVELLSLWKKLAEK